MSNVVALNTSTAVIPPGVDPFARVADQEVGMEGSFLKFKAGIWRIGAEEEVVKPDAHFAALVADIQHGFIKWVDGKVESRVMVRVADSLAPSRAELGDNDEEAWPMGPQGREDPWTFTYIVPLISVEEEKKVVFTTSSFGGRRAVGKLCQEYSRQRRKVPSTQYPIVKLGCDSYRHERYGVVQRPVFPVVDWVVDAAVPATTPADTASTILNDDIPF